MTRLNIRGHLIEIVKIPAERIEVLESDVNDANEEWVRCRLALDGS